MCRPALRRFVFAKEKRDGATLEYVEHGADPTPWLQGHQAVQPTVERSALASHRTQKMEGRSRSSVERGYVS